MDERFERSADYPQLSIMEVQMFAMRAELYGVEYDIPNIEDQPAGEDIPHSYKYRPGQEKVNAVQSYKDRHISDEVEEVTAVEVEYLQKWYTEKDSPPLQPHVIVSIDSQVESDSPKAIIKKKVSYFLSLKEGERARVVENFFDYKGQPLGFGLRSQDGLGEDEAIHELQDRIRHMNEDDVQTLRLLLS